MMKMIFGCLSGCTLAMPVGARAKAAVPKIMDLKKPRRVFIFSFLLPNLPVIGFPDQSASRAICQRIPSTDKGVEPTLRIFWSGPNWP